MRKIVLVCGAGMSTSLLVTRMIDAAKAKDVEYEIIAVPSSGMKGHVEDADVLLLGPQVSFMKKGLVEKYMDFNVVVEVINSIDYGMMKGDKVLDFAESLIGKK